MTESMNLDDPTCLALLDAYRAFFNFYSDPRDPSTAFDTLDEFRNDPDIAATLTFDSIDDSPFPNAIHMHANYDSCDIDIIAFLAHDDRNPALTTFSTIMISTDTSDYFPMICDPLRK